MFIKVLKVATLSLVVIKAATASNGTVVAQPSMENVFKIYDSAEVAVYEDKYLCEHIWSFYKPLLELDLSFFKSEAINKYLLKLAENNFFHTVRIKTQKIYSHVLSKGCEAVETSLRPYKVEIEGFVKHNFLRERLRYERTVWKQTYETIDDKRAFAKEEHTEQGMEAMQYSDFFSSVRELDEEVNRFKTNQKLLEFQEILQPQYPNSALTLIKSIQPKHVSELTAQLTLESQREKYIETAVQLSTTPMILPDYSRPLWDYQPLNLTISPHLVPNFLDLRDTKQTGSTSVGEIYLAPTGKFSVFSLKQKFF